MRSRFWISALFATMAACSDSSNEEPEPPYVEPSKEAGARPVDAGKPDKIADASDAADASDVDAAPPAAPVDMAAAILAKLGKCNPVSSAPYASDYGGKANIHVCGMKNAVYWQADMDIDCDGKVSAVCNKSTDPYFQNSTATVDSKGKPLDAATLPFVVVPLASERWNYKKSGLAMGTVVAVIYKGKIEYGIIGDAGPATIIGEASYAMAKSLGINPDPSVGGVGSGVTYVAFTGANDAVKKKENHAEAVKVGKQRAAQFLEEN